MNAAGALPAVLTGVGLSGWYMLAAWLRESTTRRDARDEAEGPLL